jgi:Putative porin
MKLVFSVILLLISWLGFSQEPTKEIPKKSLIKTEEQKAKEKAEKAPITSYRIISIERDTTYVDTSLTIKKEYEYNYLRKDNFGLLPFLNEGQSYTTLYFGLNAITPHPEFGYKAKHFNYIEANQVNYYSVATPLTELYFKTVMEQGQSLDALITLNTSERFNLSLSYKGLRSLGKYINQLSSAGNFRFTSSYNTKNKRYFANFHFTGQDLLNGENGGITTPENFESKDDNFKERQRLEVYLKDAKSFLKGKRFFLDHNFRINGSKGANNLYINHQFNYENKFFEYNQATLKSTVGNKNISHFGEAFVTGGINDQVRYNKMYNKIGAVYENATLGKFQFFVDDFRYNYYYNTVFILDSKTIPSGINDKINSIGGQYELDKKKWRAKLLYSNSITKQSLTTIEGSLDYKFNPKNEISFDYQSVNKLPNHIYNLHQSSFVNYVWHNDLQ